IYGKRKIDVEPVFGFLKANLGFTRMSVRGKPKVHNEMGFALMAVNLRKYTAINNENGIFSHKNKRKKGCIYLLLINTTFFVYLGLVMSQPLSLLLQALIRNMGSTQRLLLGLLLHLLVVLIFKLLDLQERSFPFC